MKIYKNNLLIFLFLSFFITILPSYAQVIDPYENEWQEADESFINNPQGPTTSNGVNNVQDNNSLNQEANDTKIKETKEDEIWDPFETVNRGIFWFNDVTDTYLIGPVARGYDFIMPEFAQTGVRNFFSNLSYPINLASDLIRFDFGDIGIHTSRFLINTILGIGGLFDVATEMGIDDIKTDIGLALYDYNVPAGPYIVIPFIGPSNFRDGLSMGAGTYIQPFAIAEYSGVKAGITDKAQWGGAVLDGIQTRADGEEALKSAKEASIDYYLFMQSAYYQFREGKLKKLRGEINKDNLPDENNEDEWDF